MKKKNQTFKIAAAACGIVLLIVGAIALLPPLLRLAGRILWLLAPFIAAYLVSLLANPMADGLQERFRLPRGVSAVLVIVITIGIAGGILTGVIWKIVDEIRNVYADFPMIYENIKNTWYTISEAAGDILDVLPESIQNSVNDLSEEALDWIAGLAANVEFVKTAGNAAKKLPNIFISAIVFILSLYFMISDCETVSKAVKRPFAEAFLLRMSNLRTEIKRYVGGYVRAQLIIMCIAFCVLFIGLSILKTDYALIIALAIAIFDALPFFGSGAVLLPWAVISFITAEWGRGIGLLIIYLSVVLTRQFVEPKIVSKNIGMHPIMTLMSMYVGYRTLSIGGMILGPLILMLGVSFYRVGIFDGGIKFVKHISAKTTAEFKKIKKTFQDEGEE